MPSVAAAVRKLRWSLAQRGVGGTVRSAFGRVLRKKGDKPRVHPFDVRHGTDTSGLIGGADLATGHEHDVYNTAYYGMSPSRFWGAVELWQSLPGHGAMEEYAFVDLGCGKGRAVLLAAAMPFREVVGVELHPELAKTAERNVQMWGTAGRSLSPTRIVCEDAASFVFPDGRCLLYLFNPFAAPVVERMLRGIAESFADRAGMLDVIYFNPESADAFAKTGAFALLWSGTIPMSEEDAAADLVASPDDLCHVYRWTGVAGLESKH